MKQKLKIQGLKLLKINKEILALCNDDSTRFIITLCSRQASKSVSMKLACIELLARPKEEILYITPTYKLGKLFYNELVKILKPSGMILKCNSTDLSIVSVTGSTLEFGSAELGDALRGQTKTMMILDEALFMPEVIKSQKLWHEILSPIVKVRGRKILMVSTPLDESGFFYEHYSNLMNNKPGYKLIFKTIYEDELITPAAIEEIKASLPVESFNREYLCQFAKSGLGFFKNYDKNFNQAIHLVGKTYIGVDFSSCGTDETIITIIDTSGNSEQVLITGSLDTKYMKIADIINKQDLIGGYFESNSIGEVMSNEIYKLVTPAYRKKIEMIYTSNKSKNEYIDLLAYDIENSKINFNKDNLQLKSQLGTYIASISKSRKITYNARPGFKDDRIISLALLNLARNKFKPVSKSYFKVLNT